MAGANPGDLSPLFPLDLVPVLPRMEASVRDLGVLEPLKIRAGVVADGLRRLKAALRLGLSEVPVREIAMDPHEARVHLNLGRPWTLAELACWHEGAPEGVRGEGLERLGRRPTPELKRGLALLSACPDALAEAASDRINLGVVRDLALLGPAAPGHLERLARTEATVGQRREIAFLLKILFLQKKEVPGDWPLRGEEAILFLKAEARPGLEAHLARFDALIGRLAMRKGIAVHPPEAFEEPGFHLKIHVTSENIREILEFFDRNADALKDLAADLP